MNTAFDLEVRYLRTVIRNYEILKNENLEALVLPEVVASALETRRLERNIWDCACEIRRVQEEVYALQAEHFKPP